MRRPPKTHFNKYHALGNDFIVVSQTTGGSARGIWTAARVRRLCDRHRGIGADGLIVLARLRRATGRPIGFRLFNADGSTAELSGNGLRCAARWVVDDDSGKTRTVTFATIVGQRTVNVRENRGRQLTFSLGLGVPKVKPVRTNGCASSYRDSRRRTTSPIEYHVDVGNPHRILIGAEPPPGFESASEKLQSRFRRTQGINIEWAEIVTRRRMRIAVYERGVGISQSSGTGAAASFAAARHAGLVDRRARIVMAGGSLRVFEDSSSGEVGIEGPVEPICEGTIRLS